METAGEVLQTALEFENEGRDFYLGSVDRVRDPVVKAVLAALAQDEEAHSSLIRRFYDALKRSRGWPEVGKDVTAPEPARERIVRLVGETAGSITADETYRTVYEHARRLEVASRDFYHAQAEGAGDRDLVAFYAFLERVEQIHVEVLDGLLEAMP